MELRFVTQGIPLAVIAVLLAITHIQPGRLDMTIGVGTDPHPGPGRRDHETPDTLQNMAVFNRFAAENIAKSLAFLNPADARPAIGDIGETSSFGSPDGVAVGPQQVLMGK